MKQMKRIIALALGISMSLSLLSANVWAEDTSATLLKTAYSSQEAVVDSLDMSNSIEEETVPAEFDYKEAKLPSINDTHSNTNDSEPVITELSENSLSSEYDDNEENKEKISQESIDSNSSGETVSSNSQEFLNVQESNAPALSKNVGANDYWINNSPTYSGSDGSFKSFEYIRRRDGQYSTPIRSYLVQQEDGNLLRVECILDSLVQFDNNRVVAERYTKEGEMISSQTIPMELPIWGGFYSAMDGYYFFFGQENRNEKKNEIIRVVKYSKSWKRIGTASLFGENTVVPFDAGSLRVAEAGDLLYVRTCHSMYKSEDGWNHQANMAFNVKKSTMKITVCYSNIDSLEESDYGYVSHSFNQFITTDGGDLISVDHGDCYPRSVVLCRFVIQPGEKKFGNKYDDDGGGIESVNMLPITGYYGDNTTGAAVGGVTISESHYLVAGNSIRQNGENASENHEIDDKWKRDIFVASVPKDQMNDQNVHIHWITNYPDSDELPSNPHILQLNEQYSLLIWMYGKNLFYTILNPDGSPRGTVYKESSNHSYYISGSKNQFNSELSDCKPIVVGNKIYWYITTDSAPIWHTIDLKALGIILDSSRLDLKDSSLSIPEKKYALKWIEFGEKSITPKVTVQYNGKTLTEGVDYEVSYRNNQNEGMARVFVTGKGHYCGVKCLKFKIWNAGAFDDDDKQSSDYQTILKTTAITKVKVKKKTVTVMWKKNTKGKGYDLQYSTDKKFKKAVKTVKIKKNKTAKATVKKLKKGTWYFRIRSVKGNEYSKWSGAKKVIVK